MTAVWAALFGLAFGSFLNATIDRLPRGESLRGRSRCSGCERTLRPWELVPVLSYLALRGRCATCGVSIGCRTPLVECGVSVLWAACFVTWPALTATTVAAAVTAVAGTIAATVAMRRDVTG